MRFSLLKKFSPRSFDWFLMGAVLLMIAIGLTAIYSVDLSRDLRLNLFSKQLIAVVIGLVGVFGLSLVQPTFFRSGAKTIYVVALALLGSVLVLGRQIRGTRGWFVVGGFSFQPLEFSKIALILLLAYISSRFGRRFERPLYVIGTGLVSSILCALVMLQPDLGGAIILMILWLGIICLVGIRPLHLGIIVGSGLLVVVLGWIFYLNPLQKARFTSFLNPGSDSMTSGYNVTQSTIAVGSGGIFGKGIGQGSQSQLRFLPEAQTDFIFSVIAEELGLVGVTVLIFLFGIVLWRLVRIIRKTNDDFVAVTISGFTLLLFCQFFINVGAEIGILPLTGVTVPFVSYGGSSMIIDLVMIGIVQSMVPKSY
jgi:rod shape determining protein RodA